jgi:DNA-binding LytR/AlgR family response regulator
MSTASTRIKAIIADDEALSRELLVSQLTSLWPELKICGLAQNGQQAQTMIEALKPDCAFLDIKMPGLSGMEVACQMAGRCRVVFITAYDQYAVDAFENEAVDYILKPALDERLIKTIRRLKARIDAQTPIADNSPLLKQLLSLVREKPGRKFLQWIRVQVKESVMLIPTQKVYFFKADGGYTAVMTKSDQYLIRKTISDLVEQLDPAVFFQIHRGVIVNAYCIDKISFLPASRGMLRLKDRDEVLTISRSYSRIFKKM